VSFTRAQSQCKAALPESVSISADSASFAGANPVCMISFSWPPVRSYRPREQARRSRSRNSRIGSASFASDIQ